MSTKEYGTPAPGASPAPRTLAEELRGRSDEQLARLFAARPDIATPPPVDMTQVGARAAARTSVAWAMDRLDSGRLSVVFAISELTAASGAGRAITIDDVRAEVDAPAAYVDACVEQLHAVALVWGGPQAYHLVREAHEVARTSEPPGGPVARAPEVPFTEVDERRVARLCAGTALDLVRRVDQLLAAWADDPPAVLRSGGVGVRDLRASAQLLNVGVEEVGFLVELSKAARLLDRLRDDTMGELWTPTTVFDRWRQAPIARRWADVVNTWMQSPGRAVRRLTLEVLASFAPYGYTDGEDVVGAVAWHAPRLGDDRDPLVRRILQESAWLGVTAQHALTPVGVAIYASRGAGSSASTSGAAEVLAAILPAPVDHVMLQADLTAIAPGPLEHGVARRLEQVAGVESRGGATVYRFTATSVRRALDLGWPASSVHALLAELSRTPVPQPLTYLVDDVARRHGRLRVGRTRGYIRSDDPTELDAIMADSALAGLHLHRVAPTVAQCESPTDLLLQRLESSGRMAVVEDGEGGFETDRSRPRRAPVTDVEVRPSADPVAVVAAVRAGDAAARSRPDDASAARPSRTGATSTLAVLQDAAEARGSVWLGYMDQAGSRTERIVDPLRIDAGWLTAYDHRSAKVQRFAIHRITRVGQTRND